MKTDLEVKRVGDRIVTFLGHREIDDKRWWANYTEYRIHDVWKNPKVEVPNGSTLWLNLDSHPHLFDLGGYSRSNLPYYSEATGSAEKARQALLARALTKRKLKKTIKHQCEDSEQFFVDLLDSHDAFANEHYVTMIEDAALHGDEEFFVRLGEIIKARRKRTIPNTLPWEMAYCWTKCLLWLMTDQTAMVFLRDHVRCKPPELFQLTMSAYTKTKERLGLVQHLEPPITGITVTGKLIGLDKLVSSLSNVTQ